MITSALFLDTSIHIARRIHSPRAQAQIKDRLAQYGTTRTGLVSRMEFKHRLLAEAEFLHRKLEELKSYDELQHFINRYPMVYEHQKRKKNICLGMIANVHLPSDQERTDFLRGQLWLLLRTGLQSFDASVDERTFESSCGCGLEDVQFRTKRTGTVEILIGSKECSSLPPGRCGIASFLAARRADCETLLKHLDSLPSDDLTREIQGTIEFLKNYLANPDTVIGNNPCLTVGDLMIALESIGTDTFYTMNHRESRHLCRALDQNLVVRPIRPEDADTICSRDDPTWPTFRKK